VAAAESTLAQADGALVAAQQQLRALTGWPAAAAAALASEPEPAAGAEGGDDHEQILALKDQAAVAEGASALAATQTRANPELVISTARERGAFGEAYNQTLTLGLRFPFGGGPRHAARSATARAEAIELQTQLALERTRLASEQQAARARAGSARLQLAAAERRAALARESRGFFDKSFRLGQTDLPTRLRIEAEAAEAERQAARARIELAAAISAWRQALGLLPP
jgi:outer membrane protein, heavy metal efflux system